MEIKDFDRARKFGNKFIKDNPELFVKIVGLFEDLVKEISKGNSVNIETDLFIANCNNLLKEKEYGPNGKRRRETL